MTVALRVAVLGAGASDVVRRLRELNVDGAIVVDERTISSPDLTSYQLVVAMSASDEVDVALDSNDAVDALWHDRLVPFAANLAAGRRAPRKRAAVLADSDPTWPAQARRLIGRLAAAVGDRVIRIDHIGSTSVPGLAAKDLVDIQVVVPDLDVAGAAADAARAAGFVRVRGPLFGTDRNGTDHEEAVVVDADPGRPVNVNFRPVTAPIWRETLLLRDWLRTHADGRAEYEGLKRDLAARPDRDIDAYGDDKMPWIATALGRADAWASETGWTP